MLVGSFSPLEGVAFRRGCEGSAGGLDFEDLIFPTFLFMAGASFPFSAAVCLQAGAAQGRDML